MHTALIPAKAAPVIVTHRLNCGFYYFTVVYKHCGTLYDNTTVIGCGEAPKTIQLNYSNSQEGKKISRVIRFLQHLAQLPLMLLIAVPDGLNNIMRINQILPAPITKTQ